MEVRKSENIKQGTDIIGSRTKVKIVKNKVAPPFKLAEFDIMYGTGISKEGSLLDVATELKIVNKSGAWYSYGEERLGQGRENAKELFKERPELAQEIERLVREKLALGNVELPFTEGSSVENEIEEE